MTAWGQPKPGLGPGPAGASWEGVGSYPEEGQGNQSNAPILGSDSSRHGQGDSMVQDSCGESLPPPQGSSSDLCPERGRSRSRGSVPCPLTDGVSVPHPRQGVKQLWGQQCWDALQHHYARRRKGRGLQGGAGPGSRDGVDVKLGCVVGKVGQHLVQPRRHLEGPFQEGFVTLARFKTSTPVCVSGQGSPRPLVSWGRETR